jgi:hypothetical protein
LNRFGLDGRRYLPQDRMPETRHLQDRQRLPPFYQGISSVPASRLTALARVKRRSESRLI